MKKKVIFLGTFFLLIISLFVSTAVFMNSFIEGNSSTSSSKLNQSDKLNPIKVTEVTMDVGEELNFETDSSRGFMIYVKDSDKEKLEFKVEDESVIYYTNYLYKIIALKAGTTKLTISSDKYFVELIVTVAKKNFCTDGDFESIPVGTTWKTSNETLYTWRLYTGNTPVKDSQVIEITEEDGNHVVHYSHPEIAYSCIYKSYTVEPGQYYVTARMKGENVDKDVYVRINQGNFYGLNQTTKVKGTFDWTTFESPIVRVQPKEQLKIELYFANNTGDVWFDDICIYRVITTDYTSITVDNPAVEIAVGEETNIKCDTVPSSIVDFNYTYESLDASIAEVDKLGKITAKKSGITTIIVKDVLHGFEKKVTVIVGQKDGISASVDEDNFVIVKEDSRNIFDVVVENSTNYEVVKYSDPQHGSYYIRNNKIIYSPARDFYTVEETFDSFKVVVVDVDKGYQILEIRVQIDPVNDACTITDFWLSTPKNTSLSWVDKATTANYSSGDYYFNNKAPLIYNGGYIQVNCRDVEVLYPEIKRANMTTAEREAKAKLYQNIYGTAKDGSFTLTSEKGGTVEILNKGIVQEIQDRYYSATGKIIHGVLYNYTPKNGFTGYDHFEIVVHNGEEETIAEITIYVLPDMEDYKFDSLKADGKLDGVNLLTNSEWLDEVRQGYLTKEPFITRWVEYYEAQLARKEPTANPSSARSLMEQYAILYQVTGKKEYADRCWEQMWWIVKDEEFSGDGTRRLSWGEDSNGFLDAAMVTYSVAFSYNYIKDTLSEDKEKMIVKALYEEGFYYFENLTNVNVLLHGNNHSLLINGDLAMAAFAVLSYDGDPIEVTVRGNSFTVNVQEMAANVITEAFRLLQIALVHYSPSGGWPEGPSYSIYAHRNMVYLLATIRNIYGETDGKINAFGLENVEGIKNYINYPLYTSSPNYSAFFYAESEYSNNQPALLWYTRIDQSNINAAILSKLADDNEQYNIMNLLWYQPGLFDEINLHEMDVLDFLLENHELATFRSSFGDEMALFTGLKGVDEAPYDNAHRNLDSGTFEIYALGERFIGNYCDEDYHEVVPNGFWDYDYQRWTYYKKNAQGQNTLVFNPEKYPVLQQDPKENAPIIAFESNASGGYSVVDLSNVYKASAISAYRGLKMFNNRTAVMIQDEFELREESVVYWSAHTEARIEIINDKLARLVMNGKSLYAYITSDQGTFTVMSGNTPLPGSIGEFCNLDNRGVNKLIIKLENVITGVLSVVFVPTLEEIKDFSSYKTEFVSVKDWSLDNLTPLPDIAVENIEFDAALGDKYKYIFSPYTYQYIVKLDTTVKEVPNLNVTYDQSKYKVTVEKAKLFNQLTKVIVEELATGKTRTYTYKFIVDTIIDGYEEYTSIPVVKVTGSAGAEKVLDGNANTALTSTNKEELIFELEKETTITNVLIRFQGGLLNKYYFDIYYSLDGKAWDCCYFSGSSTNKMGDEVYALGFLEAKYIKIVFNGNNNDDQVKVAKVEFYHNNYKPATQAASSSPILAIVLGSVGGAVALAALVAVIVIVAKKGGRKDEKENSNDSSTSC